MRWAKSYSIIDHELLHQGYLHRLSHEAMALYLFLVVVSDREGKSFYNETTIIMILRFSKEIFVQVLKELIDANLIEYRRPYFWVKNISECPPGRAGAGVENNVSEKQLSVGGFKPIGDSINNTFKKIIGGL